MIARLARFLGERFAEHVLPIVLWMVAIDALMRHLAGGAIRFSPRMLLGVFTAVLINACTRTTDEIKDIEVDRVYYPDRPLPTGRVTVREVYGLTFFMAGLVLVANVVFPYVLGYVLLGLVFLFLMATWYFAPAVVSKNRVLAIASNCPVYYLVCLQQAELAAQTSGVPAASAASGSAVTWAPFAVAALAMLPFLSYEFARKTFQPDGERPGYQSYSVLLGLRAATLIGFGLAALHFAAFVALAGSPITAGGLAVVLAVYGAFAAMLVLGRRVPKRALELSSGAYFVVGLVLAIAPGVAGAVAGGGG